MTSRGRPIRPSEPQSVSRRSALLAVGAGVATALAGCLGGGSEGSGEASLSELWASEPTTEYDQNHHDFVIDDTDEPRIVAPHSSHSGGEDCRVQAVDGDGEAVWDGPVDPGDCTPHAVGDIGLGSRDGRSEVFVGTEAGDVLGYDIQTGEETLRVDVLESIGYSAPQVATITGSDDELLATDFDGGLFVIDDDEVVWNHDLESRLRTAPIVEAVTGDRSEIIAAHGRRDESAITALDTDGDRQWNQGLDGSPNSMIQLEVDGEYRFAVGTAAGVNCVEAESGSPVWSDSFGETTAVGGTVGDLLVVGSNDGTIRGLAVEDGSILWETSITPDNEQRLTAPVVGDGYGDRTPLVAATTYTGSVVLLDDSGELLAHHEHGDGLYVSAQFGDLTGDGSDDLVIMDGHGRLVAFEIGDER